MYIVFALHYTPTGPTKWLEKWGMERAPKARAICKGLRGHAFPGNFEIYVTDHEFTRNALKLFLKHEMSKLSICTPKIVNLPKIIIGKLI